MQSVLDRVSASTKGRIVKVEACNGYFTGHLVFNLGEVNRVLLTPEYAAYICELTRLLGLRLERSAGASVPRC